MTAPNLRIGCLRIEAASNLDARYLSDALPAALAQAFENWPERSAFPTNPGSRGQRHAAQVAEQVFTTTLAAARKTGVVP
jgi:hypothetical protein